MELRLLSRADVRTIDRRAIQEYGVPGVALMENAGRGAAAWLAELGIDGPVAICCGKGNNGGDGYVMARHLDAWGYSVQVVLTCAPAELSGDARINFDIIQRSGLSIVQWPALEQDGAGAPEAVEQADWIVDALLGTGVQGRVREPMGRIIECLNGCPARRLAVDIPSGLDCDSGQPLGGAVRADYTATFVGWKRGLAQPAAAPFRGQVRVVDIGVPAPLLREYQAQN